MFFLITFSYKKAFFYSFFKVSLFFLRVPIRGTAVAIAALRLEGNRPNVMSRVYNIYIILTEREHCIKVFMGFC